MGLFDVTNGVPLELQYEGNKKIICESKLTKEYISKNINMFDFLLDNNIFLL